MFCIRKFNLRKSCKEPLKDLKLLTFPSCHCIIRSINYLEEKNLNKQVNLTNYNTYCILNYICPNINFELKKLI